MVNGALSPCMHGVAAGSSLPSDPAGVWAAPGAGSSTEGQGLRQLSVMQPPLPWFHSLKVHVLWLLHPLLGWPQCPGGMDCGV